MKHVTVSRERRIAVVRFDLGRRATGRSDNFTMGMDLKDAETQALPEMPLGQRRLALMNGARMCRAWAEVQALVISAIEGWCVGGGVALSVAADLRVMGRSATVYVPEIERGMNMGWGSVPRTGPRQAHRGPGREGRGRNSRTWGMAD